MGHNVGAAADRAVKNSERVKPAEMTREQWIGELRKNFKAGLFISGLDVGKTAATVLYDAVVNGKTPPPASYAPTTIVDATTYKTVFDPISLANCSNAPNSPGASSRWTWAKAVTNPKPAP